MTMSNGRKIVRPVTEEDIRKWEQEWAKTMITIWREKIMQLGIIDTMRLYDNQSHVVSQAPGSTAVVHEFLQYGIFQEAGVGNGYDRDNGGGLQILDPYYRRAHGLNKPRRRGPSWSRKDMTSGKPRKRRPWFSKKYLQSIYVLNSVERDLYGNEYMGTMSNVIRMMFDLERHPDNPLRNV